MTEWEALGNNGSNIVLRVLLIDGDPRVRQGLRVQLQLEPGVTVVGEAETGAQALALAESLRPDAVIMDVDMPGMDGLAMTRAFRCLNPCCPVLILSIYDDPARRRSALAAGAQAYVGKRSVDLFRDALQELIAAKQRRDQDALTAE